MNPVQQFITGKADMHSNKRLNQLVGGAALISIGVQTKQPFRKWAIIGAGVILLLRRITNKPVAKELVGADVL